MPTLASLDFLRGALRRRWPVWVIAAMLGLLAGIAFNQAVPPKSSASVTVLLAHDPQQDPTRAMATDVSLLGTRAVAQQVIDRLHLKVSPDDFLKSVTAHAATDQVLVVNATGPDDAAAVARAQALAAGFLSFRARQLIDQTDFLVKGYNQRVATLQAQVATLTQRIDDLSKGGTNDGTAASEAIDQRRQINAQIDGLQTTIEDATLRSTSVVAVSHIIDPAAQCRRTTSAAPCSRQSRVSSAGPPLASRSCSSSHSRQAGCDVVRRSPKRWTPRSGSVSGDSGPGCRCDCCHIGAVKAATKGERQGTWRLSRMPWRARRDPTAVVPHISRWCRSTPSQTPPRPPQS